jgi:dienelactone hydrolase
MTRRLPPPLVDEVRGALRDLRIAELAETAWPAVFGDLGRLGAAVEREDEDSIHRALVPLARIAFEGKVRSRLAAADRRAAVVTATKRTSSLPVVGAVCGVLIMSLGYALGGGLVLLATALFALFIFGVAVAGTRTNAERTEDRRARRSSPTRVALWPAPAAVREAIDQLEVDLSDR